MVNRVGGVETADSAAGSLDMTLIDNPSKVLWTLSRPPVATRPLSEPAGSTPARMTSRTCSTVALGANDQASAAAPATCGVAMLVPSK